MNKEGKHIYCIIGTTQDRNFGPIGIGGEEVLTIGYNDLSMVVSHALGKFVVDKERMITHERVIEEVMKEFNSVLPVRFGTVASSADEIRNMLDRRYREFRSVLREMDHKIELGVKGIWTKIDDVFKEITKENEEIKGEKEKIWKNKVSSRQRVSEDVKSKIQLGKMVFDALQRKKDEEAQKIIEELRRTAFEYKQNKTITDNMFMNVAFLVDKGREKEFDNIMDDLGGKYKDRIKFMYAGPLPVFNFVNITICPEEWER
jgi:hypothetical protein